MFEIKSREHPTSKMATNHFEDLLKITTIYFENLLIRQFGIRVCLEKFQLPTLFNAHGKCLGLILEETICSQCRTEIHEKVMYGAMA